MLTSAVIAGAALALLLVFGFAARSKLGRGLLAAPRRSRCSDNFRAVSVRACSDGCDAVQRLDGKRFLASEAPSVPLRGCTRTPGADATCVYVHHADRRADERRQDFGCGVEVLFNGFPERRGQFDRRRIDLQTSGSPLLD